MINEIISIPTWSPTRKWHYTEFKDRIELREYLKVLFKEPGLYEFDEVSLMFTEHARNFLAKEKQMGQGKGIYCEFQKNTKPFIQFWDDEKEKCRKGVLFLNDKGGIWYLPRFYYHWLNFLQIYDKRKEVKKFVFPEFRDVQYHMCLYECLAELHDKNGVTLKRRQVASSYIHTAKIFNKYIFEEGYTAKIGASDKSYIEGQKGCWKYLDHYRDFNNAKTAWIRHNDPNKVYNWEQRIKITKKNREGEGTDITIGTKATIVGITFEKDAIKGVGGATDDFFYEEGGVAPTADVTYGYMREAMAEGSNVTGYFSIAGSVGDLKQCKPLEKFMLYPEENDFYSVTSRLLDDTGQEGVTGLFIPIFWGYSPYIDDYGNSMIKEAKEFIDAKYAAEKKKKDFAAYQLLVSQGPRNIAEALAVRSESLFPLKYTAAQAQRIEDKEYYLKYVDLERDDNDKVIEKPSQRRPVEYNPSASAMRNLPDKRGCGVMHERPIPDAPFGTYKAAIDPVEKGETTNSESMACVYVWKDPIEVVKTIDGERIIQLEGGKLVFEWVGRYDDVDDTNEMISMVVEYYNAWAMCEINKSTWVQHMRFNKRQRYLAKKTDMVFDKDVDLKQTNVQEYGIYMTDKLWKDLLEYAINFLSEKLGTIKRQEEDKKADKIIYGVERIPYIGLIKEMQAYNETGNFDRLKAFAILIGFVKSQEAKRGGRQQRVERTEADIEQSRKLYEQLKHRNPFHNIGMGKSYKQLVTKRAFKNMH